ncbi:MAG: hypothetical protein IJW51_03795 [Clostridia bacterium]|nr:hypothetical protein [Clostridia bacterium]
MTTKKESLLFDELPLWRGNGRVAKACYPCGPLVTELDRAPAFEAQMRIIIGVTPTDGTRYAAALAANGFTCFFENTVEKNRFSKYKKGDISVHLGYLAREKRLYVIKERAAHTAPDICDPTNASRPCEFFVYGLNMDPGGHHPAKQFAHLNTTGYPNCGMLLAITTGDGRVIVIDGGYAFQIDKNGCTDEIDRFLHRITGKSEQETVTVAAWYVTHNHPDHYQGFTHLLKTFPDRYRVERLIGNIPDTAAFPKMSTVGLTTLAEVLHEQQHDCCEVKVHTGDRITLGEVTLDVLYTHEDAVQGESSTTPIKDFNDTTTVIKATLGQKDPLTVMILGDISELSEARMLAAYTKKTLKCDIAQEAHHNFNYITELYRLIAAPVMCFIQTEFGCVKTEKLAEHAAAAKKYSKRYYYNGDITKTVGFAKKDGKITEIYRYIHYLT